MSFRVLLLSLAVIAAAGKLQLLIEVFRHGAREPIWPYWNAGSFQHPGELTSVGMRQHFLLGSQLRKEYIEDQAFLSPSYEPNELFVRSTDYNRTIMSALSQLAGLYPSGTGARIPADIPAENRLPPYRPIEYNISELDDFAIPHGPQPIPVHTVPLSEDTVLLGEHADICPINQRFYDEQHASQLYKDLSAEFAENTIAALKHALNITKDIDLGVVAGINDVFLNDVFAHKPLPELNPGVFANMTYIYTMNLLYTYFGGPLQQRFIATPFLQDTLALLQAKVQNQTAHKLVMYSAHDSTLGYVYTALNLSSWQCHLQLHRSNTTEYENCFPYPAYASSLLMELHNEENGEWKVRIKVNGEYANVCGRRETECGYQEFADRVKSYLVPNYGTMCKGTKAFLEMY